MPTLCGAGMKILDVGCYDGALLDSLRNSCPGGETFSCYGIEPSEAASQTAQGRGITIVGRSVGDLEGGRLGKFDVIVLTDVFEHLPNSGAIMKHLSESLVPGGKIIITTGASDSAPYRRAKNLYYYGAMAEHIAFISKHHASWLAETYGMDLTYELIGHTVHGSGVFWKRSMISLAFLVLRLLPVRMFCGNLELINLLAGWRGRGVQNIFDESDHVMAVFRKACD